MSLESDLALANRLAEAAGAAIRPFFRAAFSHEAKADASPVTEADRAAEAAMRRLLDAEAPRDGIIGEEYGTERPDASRQWRSEEHTSELQSLMRISYAVFCLKKN